MNLFKMTHNYDISENIEGVNLIQTPLGFVDFEFTSNGFTTSSNRPKEVVKTVNVELLLGWENENFRLELMKFKLFPSIPTNMSIDECYVFVSRIFAKNDLLSSSLFSCKWKEGYKWTNHGPNSGEFIDAQTWDDNKVFVTIGTENENILSTRAYKNEKMPSRLLEFIDEKLVEYWISGLTIQIPNLMKGELCQLHFVISWGKDETATWYAVDIKSNEILFD